MPPYLAVGLVPKIPMGIVVVIPWIQVAKLHLPHGRTPDSVIVKQRHGGLLVVGSCVKDEEMMDGNNEADPCLICLGPRPHQVTYHQDQTDPYLQSQSSSS